MGEPPPEEDQDEAKKTRPRTRNVTAQSPSAVLQDIEKYLKAHGVETTSRQWTVPCNLETLWNNSEELLRRVQDVVVYVSQVKSAVSLFANWYLLARLHDHPEEPLPELRSSFFSTLGRALSGKLYKTDHPTLHDYVLRYKRDTKFKSLPPAPSGFPSHVMDGVRNEMVTVSKNHLYLNFWTRRRSLLRWRVANAIITRLHPENKERKKLLYSLTKSVEDGNVDHPFVAEHPEFMERLSVIITRDRHHLDRLLHRLRSCHQPALMERELNARLKKQEEDLQEGKIGEERPVDEIQHEVETILAARPLDYWLKLGEMEIVKFFFDYLQDIEDLDLTRLWHETRSALDVSRKEAEDMEEPQDEDDPDEPDPDNVKWPFWKKLRLPIFSPLPFNRLGRHFVCFDKKVFSEMGLVCEDDNRWWMSSVLDLYRSKKEARDDGQKHLGRIPQLCQWRDLSSPSKVRELLSLGALRPDHQPVLPGASFSTDGVSVHISLLSITKKGSRHGNLEGLPKERYTGIKSRPVAHVQTTRTGIYHLDSCRGDPRTVKDCDIGGVDPGVLKVVAFNTIPTFKLPLDPDNQDERARMVENLQRSSADYPKDVFLEKSGRSFSTRQEVSRRERNLEYKKSLHLLASGVVKKTYNLRLMTDYCKVRMEADPLRRQEMLDIRRSFLRRQRFVSTQKTLHHMSQKIMHRRKRDVRKSRHHNVPVRRKIVFFGSALFAGARGHVRVPRKQLLHTLACSSLVILVNEYNTSKCCPLDFESVQDSHSLQGDRIRQCPTVKPGTLQTHFEGDRDDIGGINICQKGFYQLLDRRLAPLYPGYNEGG